VWWQLAAVVFVVMYCASLVFVSRPASGYNTLWDAWVGNIASTLPLVPVLLRVRRSKNLRFAWAAMAGGIALNSSANLIYLFHDQNLKPVPSPAASDVPYLLAYLAFGVGVAVMSQHSFGRGHVSVRLDGAVAGLALGAVAVMLWFEPILNVSGSPLQVAVGMAYPLIDVVLLVLLVAGLAPQRYRPTWSTGLLMAGVLWFVVGDVVYLNRTAAGTYVAGTVLDATWTVGILLIGLAAWERRRSRSRREPVSAPSGIALVPVVFGLLSLALLVVSLFRHTSGVAVGMAISALGVVIARMALTLREARQAAENFRDARTDELTGLSNRRAFLEDLDAKLRSAGDHQQVGVMLVDLDGFKEVNDSLGHHAGDELLRIVGQRFRHVIAKRGSIARLGGDEFASSCVVASSADLVAVAQELSESLSDPIQLDGVTVRVGASIGVSISPDHGSTHNDLLRSADVAMYDAKRTQAAICSYRADNDLNSRERLSMIQELRTAIDTRSLTLHYQPTLDLHTETVRGVEALVRWHHPTRGLLYPDEFIPLAERVGLIPSLTRAVLEQALAESSRLAGAGHPLNMSVNISRYDLIDEDLPAHIDMLLECYGIPHNRLTLEITESCLGDDPDRVDVSIQELRSRGIRISMDDFGVGYSSMSQLLALPIDELKIDKSFVLALGSDDRALAVVGSIIALGRALNVVVVAEGVEDLNTLTTLRRFGVDVAQGYLLARSLTPDQLDAFLAQPADQIRLLPGPIAPPVHAWVDCPPRRSIREHASVGAEVRSAPAGP
jgi:diguanylate cyclase